MFVILIKKRFCDDSISRLIYSVVILYVCACVYYFRMCFYFIHVEHIFIYNYLASPVISL